MDQPWRDLYLTRHAEPDPAGDALTERGRRQAALLGRRLRDVGLDEIVHGTLPRATATAQAIAAELPQAPPTRSEPAAGDYVPRLPSADDLDPAHADAVLASLADVSAAEAEQGAVLADEALRLFTGPPDGAPSRPDGSRTLLVTHAFTIGWLVVQALGAPGWRWRTLNFCHASLTVVRYITGRPPLLLVANDLSHLPAQLRWTGFPDGLRL